MKQKSRQSKLPVVLICLLAVGLVVVVLVFSGVFQSEPASKTFTVDGFTITLNENFEEGGHQGFHAAFVSDSALVYVTREAHTAQGPQTLQQYAEVLQKNNGGADIPMQQRGDAVYFEFEAEAGSQGVYNMVVCYQGADAFWVVNMTTPAQNRKDFARLFLTWADSVKIG